MNNIKTSVARILYDLLFEPVEKEPARTICLQCRICSDKIINRVLSQSGHYQRRQWVCRTCGTPYSQDVLEGPILEITLKMLRPRRLSKEYLRAHLRYQTIKAVVSLILALGPFISILLQVGGYHVS